MVSLNFASWSLIGEFPDPTYARELMRRRALAEANLPFRGAKIRFKERVAEFEADADGPLQAVLRAAARSWTPRLVNDLLTEQSSTLTPFRYDAPSWLWTRGRWFDSCPRARFLRSASR